MRSRIGLVIVVLAAVAQARPRRADPVVSRHAKVDRIEVATGSLADDGAGTARWVARTIDHCFEHVTPHRGTANVVITMALAEGSRAKITVQATGPEPIRRCLDTRVDQLIWTKHDETTVTVKMRLVVATRDGRSRRRLARSVASARAEAQVGEGRGEVGLVTAGDRDQVAIVERLAPHDRREPGRSGADLVGVKARVDHSEQCAHLIEEQRRGLLRGHVRTTAA